MDTSETYIKMSEKAMKYLPKHHWQDGDMWAGKLRGRWITDWYDSEQGIDSRCTHIVPLLRQDQLQKMVENELIVNGVIGIGVMWHYKAEMWEMAWQSKWPQHVWHVVAPTFEQLWRAFVMKEKYQKVWNGEDWVNE